MKLKFIINNEEKLCTVLYTFKSERTNKNYLICTDNTYNDGKLNVYSFIYYPDNKDMGIELISKEEDWKEVDQFIDLAQKGEN